MLMVRIWIMNCDINSNQEILEHKIKLEKSYVYLPDLNYIKCFLLSFGKHGMWLSADVSLED